MAENAKNALVWNKAGEKHYRTGTSKMVLFPISANGTYPKGVAWNGMKSVNLRPSGADESKFYADNIKWLSLRSAEEMGATFTYYDFPDEWMACNGRKELAPGIEASQQNRVGFGFSFETILGNDTEGDSYGKEIHLVYNASCAPSEEGFQSLSDTPEPNEMSAEVTTTPLELGGDWKPTSVLTINSTKISKEALEKIEAALYGKDGTAEKPEGVVSHLPLPSEIFKWIEAAGEGDNYGDL